MVNITRRSRPFDDVLGTLAKGFFARLGAFDGQPDLKMRLDVQESDKAYSVRADIPGAKNEDIQITIDGNVVTIRAEVKKGSEQIDQGRLLRSERHEGLLLRSFLLPDAVDVDATKAKYADGVLDLTLPKMPGAKVVPPAAK